MHRIAAAVAGVLGSALVATSPDVGAVDRAVAHSAGLIRKKELACNAKDTPLLATLVQTHTVERVPLDAHRPSPERFSQLLTDRVTGEHRALDERLLGLLRSIAARHPGARIELVSGYRSAKLNEMLRKKGHHVASHSQHSLGHAVDFRVVEPGAAKGVAPNVLEREIRDEGWVGGVGVYLSPHDWFVHADVGRNRRWDGR